MSSLFRKQILILFICFFVFPKIFFLEEPQKPRTNISFFKVEADRFNAAAKNILAPAYQFLAKYLVNEFDLSRGSGIGIDVGGGPGDLILELCKYSENVYWINTDINPYYTDIFLRSALERGLCDRIGSMVADVHRLPFRNDYADIIVSRGSFQFWQDRETAFREIYRVLKPGASAFIGRGFSENMPVEIARRIREKQGNRMPRYDIRKVNEEFEYIMKRLSIKSFKIIMPKKSNKVNYGIWIKFSKPNLNP